MKRSTWAYVFLVTLAAAPVVLHALPRATPADWQAVAWLSLVSTAVGIFNFRARGQLVFTGFDGAAQLMAFLIGGLPVAVWVTALGVLVEAVLLRRSTIKSIFNLSQMVLSLWAAGTVYTLLGGSTGLAYNHPLEAFVASLAYLLVNNLLMTVLIMTLQSMSVREAAANLVDRASIFTLITTFLLAVIGAEVVMRGAGWSVTMAGLVVALHVTFHSYFNTIESARNRGAQLEAVLHATRSAILLTDPNGKVLLANEAAARLVDRPLEAILGRPLAQVLPAELSAQLDRAGSQPQILTLQTGPVRYVDWHQAAVAAAEGTVPGFVQVFTDVTPIKEAEVQLKHMYQEMVRTLTAAIDARDRYTRGHSERVSQYAVAIARRMGVPAADVERIQYSALLHDVGKVGVDDRVLRKEGPLTPDERAAMMEHPVIGAEVLEPAAALRHLIPGVRWHHEWINGGGYPDGLKGEDIPLDARIIGAADAFDAMTSSRPYRGAMTREEAMRRLVAGAGVQFDARVVEVARQILSPDEMTQSGAAAAGPFALPEVGRIRPIHGREIAVLSQLVQENLQGLDEREVAVRVCRVMARHLGPYSYTTAVQHAGADLGVLAQVGPDGATESPELPDELLALARAALRERRPVLVPDRFAVHRATSEGGLVALPLSAHGATIGVLIVEAAGSGAFHVDDLPVLATLSGQLASAVALARLHRQLTHDAWHDALTGVGNRHLFHERLREGLRTAEGGGGSLALVMVDLDRLKVYNDNFGHLAGDQVLVQYAQRMQGLLRQTDVVARYGGDEFAIILPGADAIEAARCVQRLQTLAGKRFLCDGKWLTLPGASFGIAEAPRDGADSLDLLATADRNMYQDKRSRWDPAVAGEGERALARVIPLPREPAAG